MKTYTKRNVGLLLAPLFAALCCVGPETSSAQVFDLRGRPEESRMLAPLSPTRGVNYTISDADESLPEVPDPAAPGHESAMPHHFMEPPVEFLDPDEDVPHPDSNPGFDHAWFQEGEFEEEHGPLRWRAWEKFVELVDVPHEPLVRLTEFLTRAEHDGTVFTDTENSYVHEFPIGIQPILSRPPLYLGEFGEKFLGDGTIDEGIELPTGAVWRPAFWVFGSNRLGVSYRDDRRAGGPLPGTPAAQGRNFGSVVNRLNLFGQVNLTGTEHVLIGLRPTDEEVGSRPLLTGREYSSWFWKPSTTPAGGAPVHHLDGFNTDIQSLYFEGQFDELFPFLDPYDTKFLDYGFSVGRQAMSFQRGLMMNEDMIDAVTVTRNTISGNGNLNLRMTGVFAWNKVTRIAPPLGVGGTITGPDTDAKMYGIFTESDFYKRTVNFDVGYMDDPDPRHGDLLVAAISSTQRLVGYENTYNSRFHLLASFPIDGQNNSAVTPFMGTLSHVSGQGELLFSQISWTPHETEDLVYWNTFWVIDEFTSLARAPQAGPLGDTGLLFAAAGLGLYGPALATVSTDSVGTAIGYQLFFDTKTQQVIWEVGARTGINADNTEVAGAMQYQHEFKQNWIWLITGFLSGRDGTQGVSTGIRTELQLFF